MRHAVLLSLVVLVVGFAPAPLPRHERRARPVGDELSGKWDRSGTKLEIAAGRFTHSADYDYELKTDPSATPRTYRIKGVGRSNGGWEFCGVYKVEGDTLTLSYNSGTNLPTAFDGPGKGSINEVYKRVP